MKRRDVLVGIGAGAAGGVVAVDRLLSSDDAEPSTSTTTSTPTATATATSTETASPTQAETETPTATRTETRTATETDTATPTDSPTPSPTDSPTPTATDSPTPTETATPSPTATPAPSEGIEIEAYASSQDETSLTADVYNQNGYTVALDVVGWWRFTDADGPTDTYSWSVEIPGYGQDEVSLGTNSDKRVYDWEVYAENVRRV